MGNRIKRLYDYPLIESGLVMINLIGFVVGTLYWYGPQIATTPAWLWPWLVDSPLSVLSFAAALPLVRRGKGPIRGWLATWALFSTVKYGLWTIIFWLLWWRSTGILTLESVAMTATHAAMVMMGISLLLFFRPTHAQALGVTGWFALNDYLDYWHGLAPRVPPGVPLSILQREQVIVTTLLALGLLALATISATNRTRDDDE